MKEKLLKATFLVVTKQLPQALQFLSDPSNVDVFFNQDQINLLMDKFDKAKEDPPRAAELRPDFFALANVQNL